MLGRIPKACGRECMHRLGGSSFHARPVAAAAPPHQLRRSLCLQAGKDDEAAAATPQPEQPSTSASSSSSGAARELVEGMPKAFVSEDEWREMDKKVNKYPCQRVFNAIGVVGSDGGEGFKAAMTQAVESVVGTVHIECVSQRPSSGGKYISVRIGPVWVENAEQVIQAFSNMRKDQRLKWYM